MKCLFILTLFVCSLVGCNDNSNTNNELKSLDKNAQSKVEGLVKSGNDKVNMGFTNKYREAILDFDQALTICPTYTPAWKAKANALCLLGEGVMAVDVLNKAVEISPNDGELWIMRGIAFNMTGRPEEALKSLEKGIATVPNDKLAWYHKGVALQGLKRVKEAKQALERAKQLGDEHAGMLLLLDDEK